MSATKVKPAKTPVKPGKAKKAGAGKPGKAAAAAPAPAPAPAKAGPAKTGPKAVAKAAKKAAAGKPLAEVQQKPGKPAAKIAELNKEIKTRQAGLKKLTAERDALVAEKQAKKGDAPKAPKTAEQKAAKKAADGTGKALTAAQTKPGKPASKIAELNKEIKTQQAQIDKLVAERDGLVSAKKEKKAAAA